MHRLQRCRNGSIILDTGSYELKCGFQNYDQPVLIPSLIGTTRNIRISPSNDRDVRHKQTTETFVGSEVENHKDCLVTHPVENGIIVDWDGADKLWSHVFGNELLIEPSDGHNIILCVPVLTSSRDRDKILQILFEKHGFEGVYIGNSSALALMAAGQKTGIVVDSGESVTHVVPIENGQPIIRNVYSLNLGGQDITRYLASMLSARLSGQVKLAMDYKVVKKIKEEMCKVALDYEKELQKMKRNSHEYVLSSKPSTSVTFDSEQIRCTEPLFQPSLVRGWSGGMGLSRMMLAALGKCENSVQRKMCQTIVLAGGNTKLKGMKERLKKDLLDMQCKFPKIEPRFAPLNETDPSHATWKGASILAHSPLFQELLISKTGYEERGKANFGT